MKNLFTAGSQKERKSKLIQASAPGKLFVAGEYAVVTNNHPAILVAVNQFITVSLEEAEEQGSIHSSLNGGLPIPWTRQDGKLYIDERENPFIYITQAVKITDQYVQENGKELLYFHLTVKSELDDSKGKKYGLGSSGAVTVATIKALLQFYDLDYTPELIYKLAALAHLSVNSNGSLGDIAASSYTGWIAYSCFDREWVLNQKREKTIQELVHMPWPDLMIESLTLPNEIEFLVGWTGSPASTTLLVDKVNNKRVSLEDFYPQFLKESKDVVDKMIHSFKSKDFSGIQRGIIHNRTLLRDLSQRTHVQIETKLLTTLIEIAEQHGGSAKSSGAGGGDCGIVLIESDKNISSLLSQWEQAGIQPLSLKVYQESK